MIGQTVSHYRITSRLGAGGMGVVYAAEDTRLGRTVALKMLPPDITRDDVAKQRFITEARATSSLQHRNICTIHDIEETPDGHLFLVMDHYDGETLREKIERGPLSIEAALDIARQVADGLARAHATGIVHRDIKPANVIITTEGEVKILDFGLAKLAGQTKVTKTGTTLGTVAYMSPEQTRGEEVDARTDVWSLGVMLYEMLAGARPFTGEHDLAVAYGIVNNTQPPLRTFRGDVPAGVAALLDRCLAKNPKVRFADAAALRDAMDHADEVKKGGKGNLRKFGTVAVAVVIVALAVVFGRNRFTGEVSAQEPALAIVDFTNRGSKDADDIARGMTSLVNVGLIEASPVQVVSSTYVHEVKRRLFGEKIGAIDESEALEIARECHATQLLWGEVIAVADAPQVVWQLVDVTNGRSMAGKRLEVASLIDCADDVVQEVVLRVAEKANVARPGEVRSVSDMTTESSEALKAYLAGDFHAAIRIDSTFALAYSMASHYYLQGLHTNMDSARYYAKKAWEQRTRLGVKDRLQLEAGLYESELRVNKALGVFEELYQRWPDDREILERYTRFMNFELFPVDRWGPIACRGWDLYPRSRQLAMLCQNGQPDAERGLAKARLLPRRFPEDDWIWVSLGYRYLDVGDPDSAEVAFRRGSENGLKVYKPLLGYCLYRRGDLDGAIARINADLEQADSAVDSLWLIIPYPHNDYGSLGLVLMESGRCREALTILSQLRARFSSNSKHAYRLTHGMCRVLLRMHRYDDVVALVDERVHKRNLTVDWRPHELSLLGYRANALARLGDLDGARATLAELTGTLPDGYMEDDSYSMIPSAVAALVDDNPAGALASLDELNRWKISGWMEDEATHLRAQALAAAGRPDEAIESLQAYLRINRGHALGHYELARIYENVGRPGEARAELKTFLEMWKNADEDMPQLIDARERVAGLEAADP